VGGRYLAWSVFSAKINQYYEFPLSGPSNPEMTVTPELALQARTYRFLNVVLQSIWIITVLSESPYSVVVFVITEVVVRRLWTSKAHWEHGQIKTVVKLIHLYIYHFLYLLVYWEVMNDIGLLCQRTHCRPNISYTRLSGPEHALGQVLHLHHTSDLPSSGYWLIKYNYFLRKFQGLFTQWHPSELQDE
jgi:hypothetical protein